MASQTLSRPDLFPVGTTVKAFPRSNWLHHQLPPSGAAPGSETNSQVVPASGTVTFTGLADDTQYYAGAEVGGSWKYIAFRTPVPEEGTDAASTEFTPTGSIAATDVQAAIAEVAAEGGNVGTAFDGGRAGLFALPIPGTGGTIGLGAQVLHAIRFVPGRDRAIASLKCEVTSGAAGADLDMGILDATGARLRSSGAQADLGATTGVKTCTLSSPYSLVAGTVYYAAVVSDGAVALRSVGLGNAVYLTRFGSTVGLVDYFQDNAHGTSIQATSTVDTPGGAGTLPLLSLHE